MNTQIDVSRHIWNFPVRYGTMKNNVRQHTVSRFYLKYFAIDKVMIYQFDKRENECTRTDVESVAVHKKFYLKEILEKFENVQAPSMRRLIEGKSYYALSETDRYNVRLFVRHMGVRTEQARYDILPLASQLARYSPASKIPDPRHAQNEMIRDADALREMHFTVVENKTGVPFVTSDNPVADFLIEAHLPLTPELSLALHHGGVFRKAERVELRDERHAHYQNLLQLCNAGRFAYSRSEFWPSLEMLGAARNWRKVSRYAEHNLCNARCVKPRSPDVAPYEFDLVDSSDARQIRAVQDGTWFGHWSQDHVVLRMLQAVSLERRRAGQMPVRLPGWGSAGTRGLGNSATGRLAKCSTDLWNLGTRFG